MVVYNKKLTSNKKYIVLLFIFLLGFLTLYINTSYGLFKKKDFLTDINFVVGTLDYKIENSDLTNNSIVVGAGNEYKLTLKLTSLNSIDSKYELYYLINGEKVTNNDIEIGYTTESVDSVKGTILSNASKQITVSIKNNGSANVTITFGCEGGLINNTLVMVKGNSLDRVIMGDDLIVAYTYVGEESAPERFPNKGEGYFIESVTCNGMNAEWNNATWSLTFSNVTGKNITCNFEIKDNYVTTYVMSLAEKNTNELRIDEHDATGQQDYGVKEYRYWGEKPNNYVWFNEELWRIIGVFDVDDGNGNVEKRVKIIRNLSGEFFSWDISSFNTGYGINEWSQADLMELLNNGDYYNRLNKYSNIGLMNDAKEMIGNAKWFLGAAVTRKLKSDDMYVSERSSLNGKQCTQGNASCNDNVDRTVSWVGRIGLMYPSDYGYSSNIDVCKNVTIYDFYANSSCKSSAWLYNKSVSQWTITPISHSTDASTVIRIATDASLANSVCSATDVGYQPVAYLLPNIKIIDGSGTDTQPYIISK